MLNNVLVKLIVSIKVKQLFSTVKWVTITMAFLHSYSIVMCRQKRSKMIRYSLHKISDTDRQTYSNPIIMIDYTSLLVCCICCMLQINDILTRTQQPLNAT